VSARAPPAESFSRSFGERAIRPSRSSPLAGRVAEQAGKALRLFAESKSVKQDGVSLMTRPSRLAGLAAIGVDEMASRVERTAETDILRLENLDTDIPPVASVIETTKRAILQNQNNSYLPFIG
jgi:hypothetical protein